MLYDDDDDDFDGRNARRRRRWYSPGGNRPVVVGPRPVRPVQVAPAPWEMPPPPPVVDRYTGTLKLGLILDAAAQVLASMASLPAAPVATGEGRTDFANIIAYQTALAQHAKRDEQIRTAGALARLFLV
jgi:hypothetical protein